MALIRGPMALIGSRSRRRRYFRGTLEALFDFFFPRKCPGCDGNWIASLDAQWCDTCWTDLPRIRHPWCPRCGFPFHDAPTSPDHLCGECLSRSLFFDLVRSAAYHEGTVAEGIRQLKFSGRLHWVPPLGQLLVELFYAESLYGFAESLVPVPLHRRRVAQRGFNQSALLAAWLSRKSSIPVCYDLLERTRWTRPQTRLERRERLRNVKGVFLATDPSKVKGKVFVVVDDVYTTGTTLNECARALKKAGAQKVFGLTVSRSVPERHVDLDGWKG